MAKKSKAKGPPYKVPSDRFFVVVDHPWGMNSGHSRSQGCAQNVGGWFQCMLQDTDATFTVYTRTTEDAIIVELPPLDDLTCLLGAHKWADFLKPTVGFPPNRVSNIFEYNFRNNGDPGEKNWTPWFTSSGVPSGFPVKNPVPLPTWTSRNSEFLSRFALDIKKPPQPEVAEAPVIPETPQPALPEPPAPPQPETPISSTLGFTEYVPPSHHPAHTIYPEITQDQKEAENATSEDKRSHNPKADPYEEEDAALRNLNSTEDAALQFINSVLEETKARLPVKTEEVDQKSIIIKQEEYQPSDELLRTMATLPSERFTTSMSDEVEEHKPSLVKAEEYEPSEELRKIMATLPPERIATPPTMKHEHITSDDRDGLTYTVRVKQENHDEAISLADYQADIAALPSYYLTGERQTPAGLMGPTIKEEYQDRDIPSTSTVASASRDPRRRPGNVLNSGPIKRQKVEDSDGTYFGR